jgi:hypothetical protein
MRPITLTILSAYGRDRSFFQSFERLFDPVLEAQHLPIRNPYVLKMQATFALFDWLAIRSSGGDKAWAWDFLSRPLESQTAAVTNVINRVKTTLTKLIHGDSSTIDSLREHLIGSLQISEDSAEAILWEAPRSLLMEAVPTLVRRLFRNWRLAFPIKSIELDLNEPFHPLPDFVPRNLFSDLSLPEVKVLIPPATVKHDWREETMPILQALGQLVPGRVTRRFAHERGGLSHWVPVNPALPLQVLRIDEYAEESEFVGEFTGHFNDEFRNDSFLVYRPWTVRLAKSERKHVLPSSNARLVWYSDIVSNGDPLVVAVPPRSAWRRYVEKIDFFLHQYRANASVRRFSPAANANIRTLEDDFSVLVNFRNSDDRAAALGFELDVDGVRLEFSVPCAQQIGASKLPRHLLASAKYAYMRARFREGSELPHDVNVFQRDWLWQILFSALLSEAANTGRSIEVVASEGLADARIDATFQSVMNDLFGVDAPNVVDQNEESQSEDDDFAQNGIDDELADAGVPGRLQQTLAQLITRPEVQDGLRKLAEEITQINSANFDRWLRTLVVDTLGEAILQACIAASPLHATVENLLVDIRDDKETGVATIWITETTLGGAGVLQAFAERFSAEPRIFFDAVEAALAPTDLELVDVNLRRSISLACTDATIADAFSQLRVTDSHLRREQLWQELSAVMSKRGGVEFSHVLVVALNNRLLRAGASASFDRLLLELHEHWDQLEQQFEMAIGLSEFAYVCSSSAHWRGRIRSYLEGAVSSEVATTVSIVSTVTAILWPRESAIRGASLQSYNPYREARCTDPAIVRHFLVGDELVIVEFSSPDWREQLYSAFADRGACRLAVESNEASKLRTALVRLSATPIDVGVLQFFPAVVRIERVGNRILADLTLREHS